MFKTIEWKNGIVRMIDQSRLPLEVVYIDCEDYREVAEAIRTLKIRGAPAIGIAAAMGIALGAQDIKARDFKSFYNELESIGRYLAKQRPTAVNLFWAIERMLSFVKRNRGSTTEELRSLLIKEAINLLREDIKVNKAIGRHGAKLIRNGNTILTHCNAGSLATGGYGTATAPIFTAIKQGKRLRVFADETRPILQGARLTAWELMEAGVDVTLITDNMAGALMKKGMIDLAIVGADRVARNGDVANKIGTYSVAVLCKEHKIPFYVAAPISTIDFRIPSGESIPIEERPAEEVTSIMGKLQIAPRGVKVLNPAFDVTPARYITAIITERGVFKPGEIRRIT